MEKLTCAAHSKTTAQPCRNVAGKGTDHVGQGRCRFHGGASFFEHGQYSKIKRTPIGRRIAHIASHSDLIRLHHELAFLKTALEDLIVRQQSQKEALETWHQLVGDPYKKLLHSHDAREVGEAIQTLRAAASQRPLVPHDVALIMAMATLVDKIGRTAERLTKLSAICTSDQLQQIMDRMAAIVAQHTGTETTEKIRNGW